MIEKVYDGSGLRGLLWGPIRTVAPSTKGVECVVMIVFRCTQERMTLPVVTAEDWIEEVIDENTMSDLPAQSARWPASVSDPRAAEHAGS